LPKVISQREVLLKTLVNQSGLVANFDIGDHALFWPRPFFHYCEITTLVPFGVRSFSTTLN